MTENSIIVWDSEKIDSRETYLSYFGPKLKSGKLYFWKVRWWDQHGDMAESVETGHFLTGIMNYSEWDNALWIAAPPSVETAPFFFKSVLVNSSDVKVATLAISGLGFCKPFVNGIDLNARFHPPIALIPGWTNYYHRVPYSMYDITAEVTTLPREDLLIEVLLGVGWRNKTDYPSKLVSKKDTIERVLRLTVTITYSNGTEFFLNTDGSWSVTNSPIVQDNIYNGEIYNYTNSNDRSVYAVLVTDGPDGQIYLPEIPPIVEARVEKPVNIYSRKNEKGEVISQIIDFGNNSAGYCVLNVTGATKVTIRHAEVPMHPPYGLADGSLYYENLRSARQTDLILSDGTLEIYKPTFTYHGFRYAEVTGIEWNLTMSDIHKVVIHTNVVLNGIINTSSKILNAIQKSAVTSQLSNLLSIPTDCNQRNERLGWMGDAGLSAESMMLNFDMQSFQENFVLLVNDEFISETLPDVVPYYRYGSRPADPAWGHAFVELNTLILQFYNNKNFVARYIEGMYNYIKAIVEKIAPNGIGELFSYYGDWVPPPEQPKVNGSFVSAFILIRDILKTEGVAYALEKFDVVQKLDNLFPNIYDSFLNTFKNKKGLFLNEIQPTFVLPLSLGYWNSDDNLTTSFISSFTQKDQTHIASGIIGSRFIFHVLTHIALENNLALQLAEQVDYPSWGYMIFNNMEPATGMWELWNSHNGSASMDSRNHHMFSSISSYIKSQVGGIMQAEGSYGYELITFHPASVLGLSYAEVSIEFPKPVSLSWRRHGGIQCGKSPVEDSVHHPSLSNNEGLVIDCGNEDGGTFTSVNFASFGNPTGHCGGYYKINSCHVPKSVQVVQELCEGRRSCIIPSSVDFWGDPCPGVSKWLIVELQCQSKSVDYKYSSIGVTVSVPVGSKASLYLPAYGKANVMLWESNQLIFALHSFRNIPGIIGSYWDLKKDAIVVNLDSGDYDFVMVGDEPSFHCVDKSLTVSNNSNDPILLSCDKNSSNVITSIDWASYGSSIFHGDCFSYSIGDCHAGSSRMVIKQKCVGKNMCHISINDFQKFCCAQENRLVVKFTCAERVIKPFSLKLTPQELDVSTRDNYVQL